MSVQKFLNLEKGHVGIADMAIFDFENNGRRHLGFPNTQNFNCRRD